MKRIIIALALVFTCALCGAQIKIKSYFGYPVNSAGGVDVFLYFTSKTDKVMKYVTFYVFFYNNVDDLLADDITGHTSFRLQFVGPINGASLLRERSVVFSNVIYNYQCKKMGIEKVEIEYMDGTFECINDMTTIKGYKGVRRNSIDRTIYL